MPRFFDGVLGKEEDEERFDAMPAVDDGWWCEGKQPLPSVVVADEVDFDFSTPRLARLDLSVFEAGPCIQ